MLLYHTIAISLFFFFLVVFFFGFWLCVLIWGFPDGSDNKESACNAGNPGSIPGSGRSPGEGNGNPLHYSCLENPTDREESGGLQSMQLQGVRHD